MQDEEHEMATKIDAELQDEDRLWNAFLSRDRALDGALVNSTHFVRPRDW